MGRVLSGLFATSTGRMGRFESQRKSAFATIVRYAENHQVLWCAFCLNSLQGIMFIITKSYFLPRAFFIILRWLNVAVPSQIKSKKRVLESGA